MGHASSHNSSQRGIQTRSMQPLPGKDLDSSLREIWENHQHKLRMQQQTMQVTVGQSTMQVDEEEEEEQQQQQEAPGQQDQEQSGQPDQLDQEQEQEQKWELQEQEREKQEEQEKRDCHTREQQICPLLGQQQLSPLPTTTHTTTQQLLPEGWTVQVRQSRPTSKPYKVHFFCFVILIEGFSSTGSIIKKYK